VSPLAFLARKDWSPYVAGAGLGLTATVSMAVFGKRLSGAGAYQQIAGGLGRAIAPDNVYFAYVVPSGLTWELLLLLGTFLGALAAALSSGSFRWRTMPDAQWVDAFGSSVARRWLVVFAGTALLELAGGFAGGCTASLAISGGGVLAPAAFLFMAGMFAGGVPVARWIYRRRR
jgi:hypothetical protein